MTIDQIIALVAAGESETLEFKTTTGGAARLPERCAPCSINEAGTWCSA